MASETVKWPCLCIIHVSPETNINWDPIYFQAFFLKLKNNSNTNHIKSLSSSQKQKFSKLYSYSQLTYPKLSTEDFKYLIMRTPLPLSYFSLYLEKTLPKYQWHVQYFQDNFYFCAQGSTDTDMVLTLNRPKSCETSS